MARTNIDYILFDVLTNPCVRFIKTNGEVYDNVAGAYALAPTYANTAVVLAEDANINGIPVTIPAGLDDGEHYMVFYDAASPANTDAYKRIFLMAWNKQSREFSCWPRDIGPMFVPAA